MKLKYLLILILFIFLLFGCNTKTVKIYYPDGKLNIEYTTRNDKIYGPYKEYNPDGSIKYEHIYKTEGDKIQLFHTDGKLWIEYYRKGNQLHGPYKAYYPNGNIKLESFYDEGKKIKVKRYSENGNIKEIVNYKDDLKNDSAFYYHDNGCLSQKVFYRDGKAEGLMIDYYENGNILSKIEMKGGKSNGRKTFYYQNGQVEQDGLVKDDSALYYVMYDSDGTFDQEFRAVDVEPQNDTIYLGETYKASIKFYGPLPDGPSRISVIVDQNPIDNETGLGDDPLSMGSTAAVFEYKPKRAGIYYYKIQGHFNHYVIPEKQISKGNIHTYNSKFVVLPKKK